MTDLACLSFLRLDPANAPDPLPLPARATPGSAGLDLRAALREPLTLAPGERVRVPTGFAVQIPDGFEGQVRPRSGLAWKHGITVLNAPGTIDADYRGPLDVLLINLGHEPVTFQRGDRIAQLVLAPVTLMEPIEVHTLNETERKGGFGHTGL